MRVLLAVALTLFMADPSSAQNRRVMGSGVALLAGGAVMSILASTAAKTNTCAESRNRSGRVTGTVCVAETNKGLLYSGLGVTGLGATMIAIGMHQSVLLGPQRIAYRVRW